MRMDLTVTDYPDRAALEPYMYGSAEVIGLQMLPVLGTVCPREEAAPYAAALGKAFQLTNFLRDVDEDLSAAGSICPPTSWLHTSGPRCADVVPHQPAHRRAGAPRADRTARRDTAHLRYRAPRHFAAAAAVAAVRRGRAHPVLGNPGPHRGRSTSPSSASAPPSAPAVASGSPRRTGQGVGRASARTTGHDDGPLAVPVRPRGVPGDHGAAGDASGAVCTGSLGAPRGAVLPVAAVFVIWDAIAIAAHVWTYNPQVCDRLRAAGLRCRSRNCCSSW